MSQADKAAAMQAAEDFISMFNAQDHQGLAGTLNYPHVRFANGRFVTIDSGEDFAARSERGAAILSAEGWHHTVLRSIEVVHSAETKVHLALEIDRCREDGSVYNQFDTLWIATCPDGHWGIQFRSSYLR